MKDYQNISFVHPATGQILIAETVPDDLSVKEVIFALIDEGFLCPEPPNLQYLYDSYALKIIGGSTILGSELLASGGLHDGCIIHIARPDVIG